MRPLLSVTVGLLLTGPGAWALEPDPAPAAPAAPAAEPASPPTAAAAPDAEATPAEAPAPLRLAVVALDAPGDLAVIGRGLAEAVAQELTGSGGLEIIGPADVLRLLGPEAGGQVAHCGENVACYLGAAERLGAQRVLGGWLAKVGTTYRFGLVHIDVAGRAALGRVARQVPIASRRLRSDLVAAAGPLVRGEAEGTGLLSIATEAPGADVRIDDRPAGRTPLETRLPAGKHRVEVRQQGKMRVDPFWVDVPSGGRVRQRVRLFDIPLSEMRPGEVETKVDVGRQRRK